MGMLHSVFWSLVFGFFMAASFILAIPTRRPAPRAGSIRGSTSTPTCRCRAILKLPARRRHRDRQLHLRSGRHDLDVAHALCLFRDGGLPASNVSRHVSPKYRTPVGAIWLTAALSAGAAYYAPFMLALAAGCALFLYVSYAMPIAAGMMAEGKTWTAVRPVPPRHLVEAVRRSSRSSAPDARLCRHAAAVQPDHPAALPAIVPIPFNWLSNPLIFIAVALAIGWFVSEARRFKGPPIGAGDRQATGRACGPRKPAVGETVKV